MISVRRRGTTEEDRRGGYAEETYDRGYSVEAEAPVHTIEADVSDVNDSGTVSTYGSDRRSTVNDDALGVQYTLRTYGAPETARPVSRPENVTRKSADQIMPKIQRENEVSEKREEKTEKSSSPRMTVKNKAALFGYLAAVVVLAVLVIVSGVAISTVNEQSDALRSEIFARNERLFEQNAAIADLTDPSRIENEAIANGMEKIEDPEVIELLPKVNGVKYEGRTNAFDKFCDWLSNFFGG